MAAKILIVDDEKDMLALLERILSEKTDHEVTVTDNPMRISELLGQHRFDIVLTDLKMPGKNGIQVLDETIAADRETAVIVMTAYATIESAVEATRKGAFDYITKPFRKERLLHLIDQALRWKNLQSENRILREELENRSPFPSIIGSGPTMRRLLAQIERVAGTSATVLITGESGTGKELAARAVHNHSAVKDKIFTPINCGAIPESIIESELFGHVKGAFTGAHKDKKGLVEEARGGTLFLDEIGDLPPALQVKLLRLLQEGEYRPVGAGTIRKADVRFIAATNQNLADKIKKGEFREDLYYRLNVVNIHLPPLRERADDIPLLASNFLKKYAALHGKAVSGISRAAMEWLAARNWPGNIRELENTIERAVIMTTGETVDTEDLFGPAEENRSVPPSPVAASEDIFELPFKEAKDKLIEEFQAMYIARALARNSGNVSQAAKELGVKRQYLHRLMKDADLESRSFRKPE